MKVYIFYLICAVLLIITAILTQNSPYDFQLIDTYFTFNSFLFLMPLLLLSLAFGFTYLFWSFKEVKLSRLLVWLQAISFSIGSYFVYLFFEPSLISSSSYTWSDFDLSFILIPFVAFLLSLLIFMIIVFQVIYRSHKKMSEKA